MARCTAKQTAENITTSFIGWHDTVGNHKCYRTDMVCDHTDGNIFFVFRLVLYIGIFADFVADGFNRIYVKNGIHILHYGSQTLQSHTGINVFIFKFFIVAISVIIELGKYVVPDLDITVTIAAHRTSRFATTVFLSTVIINFRTRTTRTCTMLPEIVFFSKAEDTVFVYTDFFIPNVKRLIVVLINRRIQTVRRNLQYFCQKFPRPGNGFMFEIISKRKVSKHFKKRQMARSLSDVFNIIGADTLLASCHARSRRRHFPHKVRL